MNADKSTTKRGRVGGLRAGMLAGSIAGAALQGTAAKADAFEFNGALAVTSHYVFRGLSQSDGRAALQADAHLSDATGWLGGIWASTSRQQVGYARSELDAYLSRYWTLDNLWTLRLGYVRYFYPQDDRFLDYDYGEFAASIAYSDRLSLNVAWSPDATQFSARGGAENRNSYAYELTARQPLWAAFSLTASAGLYDLHDLFGKQYAAWSAGLVWQRRKLTVEWVYFGVDATARRLFPGRTADGKAALSGAWRF